MKNNKGFISISVVYSFFLVFIAIVMSVILAYSSRRLMLNEIKNDVRNTLKSNISLANTIINKYGGKREIQEISNFGSIADADDSGLFKTEDNYGTSYYFRGNVSDNYVKFGKWQETRTVCQGRYSGDTNFSDYNDGAGWMADFATYEECLNGKPYLEAGKFGGSSDTCFCYEDDAGTIPRAHGREGEFMYWRIVRINGDGTIRLIYDGTAPDSESASVGFVNYQNEQASFGRYTYDSDEANAKWILDYFYENNLAHFDRYIADSYFCNDVENFDESFGEVQGWGDETLTLYKFAAYERLVDNSSPELICKDMYTLDVAGGSLNYPIGLITADEVVFAGGKVNEPNTNYYLYTGNEFDYTMTGYFYRGADYTNADSVVLFAINSDGKLDANSMIDPATSARPVINLKVDVDFTGSGTIDDPYVIGDYDE